MLYHQACEILGVSETATFEEIKYAYKRQALCWHPDKNKSENASQQFILIKEAYSIVSKRYDYLDNSDNDDCEYDCDDDSIPYYYKKSPVSYASLFTSFVRNLVDKKDTYLGENNSRLYTLILTKLVNICESSALEYLKRIDRNVLSKIYDIAKKYNDIFHFSNEFLDKVREINLDTNVSPSLVIINPLLEDLLENNLYKLNWKGETLIVPLWHTEMVFDVKGEEVTVQCCPILPEHIEIDENNDIIVSTTFSISKIWGKITIPIVVGSNIIYLFVSDIRLIPTQDIVKRGEGISVINTDDIYCVNERRDIIIRLHLTT